jgi:hypothetical protein
VDDRAHMTGRPVVAKLDGVDAGSRAEYIVGYSSLAAGSVLTTTTTITNFDPRFGSGPWVSCPMHEGLIFTLIDKGIGRIYHIAKAVKTVIRVRRIHIVRGVMVRAKLWFDMTL